MKPGPKKRKQLTRDDILAALERRTMPKIRRYVSPYGLEAMDVVSAYDLSYAEGNVFKYVVRRGAPKDFDGLSKAYWYALQELQRLAKDPLARLSSVARRRPSVGRIASAFGLNDVQTGVVRELLRRRDSAAARIRDLLKVVGGVKELIDHADAGSAGIEAGVPSGKKARPGQKKRGKKRP